MTAEVTPELYGIIEEKGIDEVSLKERRGSPKAVFGLWMAANIEFATLTTGALATGWLGLSFASALLAILIANVLGGLVLAFFSTFGVDYGRPQMIQGANWFGPIGNKLPSLLNFFGGFSWFAVNTIAGAYALQYFFGGSLILGVVILSLVQVTIAFFGHDLIQTAEKYLVYVLTLAFLALTVVAVQHLGLSVPANVKAEAAVGGFSGAFILTVSIMVGYMVGWIPYSSDYTRYLRIDTGAAQVKKTVFSYAFLGAVISTVWIEALGALLGAAVSFTKPSDLFTSWMPEWFKVPFLIAVVLGTISANILNIYSATLSALAVGVKLKQHIAALITGGIGTVIAVLAAANFITNYENFLLVLGYWTMPWIAITLLCHLTNRVSRLPVSAAFVAWVAAIAVSWPFYNQALYVGPVAAKFPQIGDATFIVSFVAAAVFYYLLSAPAAVRQAPAE
ncbi:cytosine permease [Acidocella sp. KAb 2-4]|uniref:purine-cytosine permease family protein n=1 Tax=Acidocella sp. KAb 2-4 TaxID=2885158 RepID=UPI001D076B43|nr:cytosine permease [Acidocella sp. KAb 2-4]MCB5943675.1 cytosine permease [Acidocella sp. KAb 2-4]